MQRINAMETELFGGLTQAQKLEIVDILKDESKGNVVNQKGKMIVWTKDPATQKKMLELIKINKGKVTKNFPNFYDKDGEKVTEKNLKDKVVKDLITPTQASAIIAEKNRQEAILELRVKLEATSFTKAMIEKEYGVSTKVGIKEDMILAVIEKLYGVENERK